MLTRNTATELFQPSGTGSSHSHTITAGANAVFVALMTNFGIDDPSATYGGVAMTLIGSVENGPNAEVNWFRLLNPAAGAQTVVVSWETSRANLVVAVDFSGAHPTDPDGTVFTATGSSQFPSVDVTGTESPRGELVMDAMSHTTGSNADVGSGQTALNSTQAPGRCSTEPGNDSTVTMSWDLSSSNIIWALAAFRVIPRYNAMGVKGVF